MNLVEVKGKEIYTDSLVYAEKFGILHRDLLEKIRKLTAEVSAPEKYFKESKFTNKQGREYVKFLINKKGFSLLIMNTNAKGVNERKLLLEMQENFIEAFFSMEQALMKVQTNNNNVEWLKHREVGKGIRLALTDTLKEFEEYAVAQGSKNAKRYYVNVTKMEYKALSFVQSGQPKVRELLDTMELHQLLLAEQVARKSFRRYMDQKLHYKEIYILVKQDIENLAKILLLN